MNRLEPFCAAFYGEPHLRESVAPPYDIISPEEHATLLARSPHNVVRLTLGLRPGEPGDFADGAELLRHYVTGGIIEVDPEPRLYVYSVTFMLAPHRARFTGLVGTIDLSQTRVHAHEMTLARVKEDRLRQLSGTRANLGLVFLVCRDGGRLLALLERGKTRQRADVLVGDGERHTICELDPRLYGDAAAATADLDFVIADGHHRFQTAREFARRNPDLAPAGRVMVALGSLETAGGLLVLPTHRELRFDDAPSARAWAEQLERGFSRAAASVPDLMLYHPGAPAGVPLGYGGQDDSLVAYLHREFIDRLGGGARITYLRDDTAALARVRAGEPIVLLHVRAVTGDELMRTVRAGRVFPPKSTYFHPKLYSGLVMRLLDFDAAS